ncbi:hypothetical protein H5410_031130 [Solanum commersonii]|uniref:Uncharacterized protein n=1 Tax=Solanum commersonii TaxID=4109 RepID=A0A9J5YJD0_SOLCO|nr:hypothetical protein H5410_031130 [Solanum commersonii]
MSTHSLGNQSMVLVSQPPSRASRIHMGGPTHFQLGEEELLSSILHKTLSKLERKISVKIYCVAEDCSGALVEIADELGDPPFDQLIAFSVLPLAFSHSG